MKSSKTTKRRTPFVSFALCAMLAGTPAGAETDNRRSCLTTNLTAGLEPVVAAQLDQSRAELARRQDLNSDAAALAQAYGALGMLYHAYELDGPARDCYTQALSARPDDYRWQHLLGLLHGQAGRVEAAAAAFETTLALKPGYAAARVRLALIRMEEGDEEAAESTLAGLDDLSVASPAVTALLGDIALSRRQYSQAIGYYDRALAAVPDADRLYYPLALAYRGLGQRDKALAHLAQRGTVGIEVDDPLQRQLQTLTRGERLQLLAGRAAFRAGRYADAVSAFRAAVSAAPRSARAHVNLGTALAATGESDAALNEFQLTLDIDPNNLTAHFNLGQLAIQAGDYAKAVVHYDAVVRVAPDDDPARLGLADALQRLDRHDDALRHYRLVATHTPDNLDARLGEAIALVDLGQYAAASDVLDDAHRRNPSDGRIVHALAKLLAGSPDPAIRDPARAVALAQRVVAAQPSATHMETLAMALAGVGDCVQAVEQQRAAINAAASAQQRQSLSATLDDYRRCAGEVEPQH